MVVSSVNPSPVDHPWGINPGQRFPLGCGAKSVVGSSACSIGRSLMTQKGSSRTKTPSHRVIMLRHRRLWRLPRFSHTDA